MTEPARTFPGECRVRLGDVTGTGRMRLDALARSLQDVATDDAADAGLPDGWVLRRLALTIERFPAFREDVELLTWCSGVTASAAERRTTLSRRGQVLVEAVALWVSVGADGRPARLDRARFAAWGIPADRRISTRLRIDDGPEAGHPGVRATPWPLRAADVDVLRHVNNAVSLAAVEDVLHEEGLAAAPPPWTVEVEYRAAIDPDEQPELVWARRPDGTLVGGLRCAGTTRSSFRLAVPELTAGRT